MNQMTIEETIFSFFIRCKQEEMMCSCEKIEYFISHDDLTIGKEINRQPVEC